MDALPTAVAQATTWLMNAAPRLALLGCTAAMVATIVALRRRDTERLGPRRGVWAAGAAAALVGAAALLVLYGTEASISLRELIELPDL